jgi:DNA-binding winged helix-turn-helix (wHTH) protein
MSKPAKPVYLFGPFVLNPTKRLLSCNKEVVPLTSKAFEVLHFLVQNSRTVLNKEEMLRQVWPDTIVEEANLAQTIFMLRKALGESPKEHRYIVTVPKRGYCFVADVREMPGHESAPLESALDKGLLSQRYPENTEAYQLCLKGRYFWEKRTGTALEKALNFFRQAIEKDPQYAKAYAGLADCYTILSHYSRLSPKQTLPKAKAAALKALEIDDTLVEAHASLAIVKMLFDWDWRGAEVEFLHAFKPGKNYATAHHWYGMYLAALGQFDRAIAEMERARELDPLSLAINTDLGLVLYLARRYDDAIQQYRSTMELDSSFPDAQVGILMAYNEMGMHYQPISEFLRSPQNFSRAVAAKLEDAYAQSGVRGYWRAYLDLAEDSSNEVHCSPYVMARIYAEIGEKNGALQCLKNAYEEHDGGLSLLRVDPSMDSLHGDPVFVDILERVFGP